MKLRFPKPKPAPTASLIDRGSGISYGICRKCGKGHGYLAYQSNQASPRKASAPPEN